MNCGIANKCEASSGLIARVGLPLSRKVPPTRPVAWARNGSRSPDAPSYWKIVTCTSECAGNTYVVECRQSREREFTA